MSSLYIVMPADNEEGNIENVVKDWYEILNEYDEKSKIFETNIVFSKK